MAPCKQCRVFVGNSTLFIFQVVDQNEDPVDLSGLSGTQLEMLFLKPDGSGGTTLVTFAGIDGVVLSPAVLPETVDGKDGRYQYEASASTPDIDQDGNWKRQGHITLAGGQEFFTEIVAFKVFPILA